jgi:hypothetical protein
MKVIELVIESEKDGIEAISVVDRPAIEENFIALAEEQIKLAEVSEEKRILMGAALIPEKKIYRVNEKTKEEFYVYFSKETVRKASELFFINANQSNATEQHAKVIKDMTVVESWIIEDTEMDKSKKYDFNLPVGTWMISMKCNNDDVWDKVKNGEIKGFSIEGYFADKLEMAEDEKLLEQIYKILNDE